MNIPELELNPGAMRRMGDAALRAVVDFLERLPDQPASDIDDRVEVSRRLREPPPDEGTDFDRLLRFLMEEVFPKSTNHAHPSFMAYIPAGGLFPSAVADFMSAAVNRYTGVWFCAPAAARLEGNVIEWFTGLMGYDPAVARGVLTSGGSLANFSAVVTARRHLLADDELHLGTVYASDQVHHSAVKAAVLAGIPERNIRMLESDKRFRANPARIEVAIRGDRERGMKPFLVIGSAGTTNTGAVDPLDALADLCHENALWLHIDAAYGGFFRLCDKCREILAGIGRADSVVLDPHKGLFIPHGAGCLLVKEGELLRRAHVLDYEDTRVGRRPAYMDDTAAPEGESDFHLYSPELTRPFRGLRVWLPLKLFGLRAFREALDEKLGLAQWFYDRLLEEEHFECPIAPDLSVVVFRRRPRSGDINEFNRRLLKHVNQTKKLYITGTTLRGEFMLRVCILNFRTHRAEVENAFEIIRSVARELDA